MPPRHLLPVLFLLLLCGCSTPPPAAPAEIPEPPVVTLTRCPAPADLPDLATANELVEFALGWVRSAACERAKRIALLEAWPR